MHQEYKYEFVKSVLIELNNPIILVLLELCRHTLYFIEHKKNIPYYLFIEFSLVADLDMEPVGYSHLYQRYQFSYDHITQ